MDTQNKIFANYDKRMDADLASSVELKIKEQFLRNVFEYNFREECPPPNGQQEILEIGCNKGFLASALRDYYPEANIHGVDLSPNDIDYAKRAFPTIDFSCENAFDVLKPNSFDLIIAKDVMEHIAKNEQENFVENIYAALKQNGVCIIQVPNMDWLFSNHERYMDFTHEIGYTRESFKDIFRLYFGSNVKVKPSSYIWPDTMSLPKRILFKHIRPKILWGYKVFLKFMGEGAVDTWFHYREIMAVCKKC